MRGGGEVPELALARSDRFVRVLSGPLVELPTRAPPVAVSCVCRVRVHLLLLDVLCLAALRTLRVPLVHNS